jgi:hypothetical protein
VGLVAEYLVLRAGGLGEFGLDGGTVERVTISGCAGVHLSWCACRLCSGYSQVIAVTTLILSMYHPHPAATEKNLMLGCSRMVLIIPWFSAVFYPS